MKIVLDTNVLISSFMTLGGVSHYVFRKAARKHHLFISRFILEELELKLTQKFNVPKNRIRPLVEFLKKRADLLHVKADPDIDFKDKKDIPILSLVRACKAHYLITGDKALLSLKKFGSTLVLNPREAVGLL